MKKIQSQAATWGRCKQIPEAFSQGRTVEELMANMKEAVCLAIDCREEH